MADQRPAPHSGALEAPPPIESPCNGACELARTQVCTGCGRTIAEITGWASMGADQRRSVMRRLAAEGNLPMP